jgi:hypothetical protein
MIELNAGESQYFLADINKNEVTSSSSRNHSCSFIDLQIDSFFGYG